ncbi:hypothetical protein CRUP_023869 [Coryphaenoides rupestris]|nr:hypothetical protein CRUP_023869 [Coryphaenoides rupestris]
MKYRSQLEEQMVSKSNILGSTHRYVTCVCNHGDGQQEVTPSAYGFPGVQSEAPFPEEVLRGQGVQEEEPPAALNQPGRHGKHSDVTGFTIFLPTRIPVLAKLVKPAGVVSHWSKRRPLPSE